MGELLLEARSSAGLSARALALRAGTSTTTVTRIERGDMDPTVGMLSRLLEAAGQAVSITMRAAERPLELANLTDAWTGGPAGDRPDWTRLRSLLDDLALQPARAGQVIARRPKLSGSPVLDALLAAIADKVADDAGLARPSWTAAKARRVDPAWETPGTPRMREKALEHTPPQLLEHGIIASADSLWRSPELMGV